MSIRRRVAAVGVVFTLALIGVGPALAATPQAIYRDLADNGRLDRKYKPADLQRALSLAQPVRTDARRAPTLRDRNLAPDVPATAPAPRVASETKRLPFSGLDFALLIAGGGPLLLIGAGLRRRLDAVPGEPPVASA